MSAMKNFSINVADMISEIIGGNACDHYDFCAVMGHESDYHDDRENALFVSVLDGLVGEGDQDAFNLLICQLFDTTLYSRDFINGMFLKHLDDFEREYFMSIVNDAAAHLRSSDPDEYGDVEFYPYIAELLAV